MYVRQDGPNAPNCAPPVGHESSQPNRINGRAGERPVDSIRSIRIIRALRVGAGFGRDAPAVGDVRGAAAKETFMEKLDSGARNLERDLPTLALRAPGGFH